MSKSWVFSLAMMASDNLRGGIAPYFSDFHSAPTRFYIHFLSIWLGFREMLNFAWKGDIHVSPVGLFDWSSSIPLVNAAACWCLCLISWTLRLWMLFLRSKCMLWAAGLADTSWRGPLLLFSAFKGVSRGWRTWAGADGISVDGAELAPLSHLL